MQHPGAGSNRLKCRLGLKAAFQSLDEGAVEFDEVEGIGVAHVSDDSPSDRSRAWADFEDFFGARRTASDKPRQGGGQESPAWQHGPRGVKVPQELAKEQGVFDEPATHEDRFYRALPNSATRSVKMTSSGSFDSV